MTNALDLLDDDLEGGKDRIPAFVGMPPPKTLPSGSTSKPWRWTTGIASSVMPTFPWLERKGRGPASFVRSACCQGSLLLPSVQVTSARARLPNQTTTAPAAIPYCSTSAARPEIRSVPGWSLAEMALPGRPSRNSVRVSGCCVAGLAVFVACLGLFGLASFTAEQRSREIGVRKALGASVAQVVLLLSREFTALVVAANLISWPVAYWFLNDWLEHYHHRVDLGIDVFLLSGIAALVMAWLTVSSQALRAGRTNPVEALRY